MTDPQIRLLNVVLLGELSKMSKEDQRTIRKCKRSIEKLLRLHPTHGAFAIVLAATEVAIAEQLAAAATAAAE